MIKNKLDNYLIPPLKMSFNAHRSQTLHIISVNPVHNASIGPSPPVLAPPARSFPTPCFLGGYFFFGIWVSGPRQIDAQTDRHHVSFYNKNVPLRLLNQQPSPTPSKWTLMECHFQMWSLGMWYLEDVLWWYWYKPMHYGHVFI